MPKERTPEEVYEDLSNGGYYEEANLDSDEIKKMMRLSIEDYEYGKRLRKTDTPNWRVIFNIHYDALRELCSQLMRFYRQKISNHQGLFAFIVINFKELDLDWNFFEKVRTIRNQNKYTGKDIDQITWKEVELQIDTYISTIEKESKKRLNKL